MSAQPEDEPDPVVIEITADAGPFIKAVHRAQAELMFAFHPDLRDTGPVRPDEEPT